MLLLLAFVPLTISWLIPFHFPPWSSFQHEWLAALGGTLCGFAAVQASREGRTPAPWFAWLAAAAAIIPIVQWLSGVIVYRIDAILSSLYLAGLAMSIASGAALARYRRDDFLNGLFLSLLLAAIASTGAAMFQWLQLGPSLFVADLPPHSRPFGNLSQPNHLATLIALGLTGLLRAFEKRQVGAVTCVMAAAWLGLGLVLTQSRTSWLVVIAFAILYVSARGTAKLRMSFGALGLSVGTLLAGMLLWPSFNEAIDSQGHRGLTAQLEPGPRIQIWTNILSALSAAPPWGYGWSQVTIASQQAITLHPAPVGVLSSSHNLILDLLVWNGVPIGLVIAGSAAVWLAKRLRGVESVDHWALMTAICIVLIHAAFEFPLSYAYFLVPVGLMIGARDGVSAHGLQVGLRRGVFCAALLAVSVVLGWVAVEYGRVERSHRDLRFVLANIGRHMTVAPPEVQLLDAQRDLHRFMSTPARTELSDKDLGWMRAVVSRYPTARTQLHWAMLVGLNGLHEESHATLVKLCKMHRPAVCINATEEWRRLQKQYPALRPIEPATA
jgi:hypothetical protein